jgi:hypothetical protein
VILRRLLWISCNLVGNAEVNNPLLLHDILFARAIELGWLWRHQSLFVKFTPAGTELFA